MQIAEHPTVRKVQSSAVSSRAFEALSAPVLREICLQAGAADAGFVDIDRPELDDQRTEMQHLLSGTKTVISFVCRMNRSNIQTPARSIANLEFHHASDDTNETG